MSFSRWSRWLRNLASRSTRRAARGKCRERLEIELLEDRVAPATYTVVNTLDSGAGSLRQAILDSNASVGVRDTIEFNIDSGGVQKIRPTSALPTITDAVTINAYSQPGAAPNSAVVNDNAVLLIHLDGALAGFADGLTITAGNTIVRGLVISRFVNNGFYNGNGIVLQINGGNVIEGCFIGTDATGLADQGNGYDGIRIADSGNNTIGGLTPAARNVISGNGASGVNLSDSTYPNPHTVGNVVAGNFIGVTANGTAALGNSGRGVNINNADGTVGDASAAARNILSANAVRINSGSDSKIRGNYRHERRGDARGQPGRRHHRYGIQAVIGVTDDGLATSSQEISETAHHCGGSGAGLPQHYRADCGTHPGQCRPGHLVVSGRCDRRHDAGCAEHYSRNQQQGITSVAQSCDCQGNYIGTDITGTQDLATVAAGA